MPIANLLLVDDERQFVEILSQRLARRDFAVTCAYGGQEALERLDNQEAVDVVILDVKMPGMDGVEATRLIKEKHPLVEIVMLTGRGEVNSAVEAIKSGAFDYLMKPCDLDQLIVKVNGAAKRKNDRESKILEVRIRPYITDREKDKLISAILES